jgi:hypothetical protein
MKEQIQGFYCQPAGVGLSHKLPYYDTRINKELVGCLNHPSGFQILVDCQFDKTKVWINVKKEWLSQI